MDSRVRRQCLALATLCVAGACGGTSATQLSGPDPVRCGITLSPPAPLPSSDATGALTLETSRDCAWSASVNAAWVQLSPSSGQGSATLVASASDNTSPQLRSAVITVNDQSWTLTQAGAPVSAPPPPPPVVPPAAPPPPPPDPEGSGGSDDPDEPDLDDDREDGDDDRDDEDDDRDDDDEDEQDGGRGGRGGGGGGRGGDDD